jgi:hypothetical protein
LISLFSSYFFLGHLSAGKLWAALKFLEIDCTPGDIVDLMREASSTDALGLNLSYWKFCHMLRWNDDEMAKEGMFIFLEMGGFFSLFFLQMRD